METNLGQSTSIWMRAMRPSYSKLAQNLTADVCVVGAGIAGITTAYLLGQQGKSVVILDDGPVGGGQTERTTAHLASAIDDGYAEIERLHGERGAQIAAESHTTAIDLMEKIVRQENVDCGFERVDGYLFSPPGESPELLKREFDAAKRAGLAAVELVERAPIKHFDTGPALRFPRQGQFHPLRYLSSLSAAIVRNRGSIFTDTHVTEISGNTPALVRTSEGFEIRAAAVVVATNTPINDLVAIHTKQAAYLTYVIGARVPKGSVTRALFWDTLDPYHYVRTQSGEISEEFLIVGGEDHKTGQSDDASERYARLEAWTRERFPMIEEVVYRWSGQVMEPIDGLGFIGRNPLDKDNIYVVTG